MTKQILVAIDLEDSSLTEQMLSVASDLAKLKAAEVTLIYVAAEIAPAAAIQLPEGFRERTSADVSEQLADLVNQLDLPAEATRAVVRFGSIYREILTQAQADKADLIVIGCHKPDLADYLLGPNAARVMRHASCSVYVVR